MKTSTLNAINAIAQGTASQIYSRLVLAAMTKQVVFMKDLTPICYGIHFTKFNDENMEAMGSVLDALIEMDFKAGRLPLAALLVSRFQGGYTASNTFFIRANKLYKKNWNSENWEDLVEQIHNSYHVPGWTIEAQGQQYVVESF